MQMLTFPGGGRHQAIGAARQVNGRSFAEAESPQGLVLHGDAHFHRELVVKDIYRPGQRLGQAGVAESCPIPVPIGVPAELIIARTEGMEIGSDDAFLDRLYGIERFGAGPRRVETIVRTVHQRSFRVVQKALPVGLADAVHEPVGIEAGAGDHGQYGAVVRVQSDDGAAIALVFL
jgi:hypothetical protein